MLESFECSSDSRVITTGGGLLRHPIVGGVLVSVNARSRKISARWSQGKVKTVVPYGCRFSDLTGFLDANAEALLRMRPETPQISDGTLISLPLLKISMRSDSTIPPGQICACRDDNTDTVTLLHHPDTDISDTARFSRVIERSVGNLCGQSLVNHARQIAASLRLTPRQWRLGTGKRVLGTCSSLGVITLSRMLLFLSEELMDYVILHELAHLRHHDHSPAFHTLLDSYCGGRERELAAKLRSYRWPIVR